MTDHDDFDWSPLSDDDPHYNLIGRVACSWGILEQYIDSVIAGLAKTDQRSMACVTAQLIGPARRMDALIALIRYTGGSAALIGEFKSFQGQVQQLGEDRNRIVHDPLVLNKKTKKVHKSISTAKGKLEFDLRPVSIDEMKSVHGRIVDASIKFTQLRAKIDAEMTALQIAQLEHTGVFPFGQNPPSDGS